MRMTQELSRQIAIKLMTEKRKKENELLSDFQSYVYAEYEKQVPREVKAVFKKHPGFFGTTKSILLNGMGFNYETVSTPDRQVAIRNKYHNSELELDADISKKCNDLKRGWQKIRDKNNDLQQEIESTLYGLRTFAQVQKHLPEAVPYLPKSTSMELIVDLNGLRKKIKESVLI